MNRLHVGKLRTSAVSSLLPRWFPRENRQVQGDAEPSAAQYEHTPQRDIPHASDSPRTLRLPPCLPDSPGTPLHAPGSPSRSPAAGQARVRKLYRAFAPARAFVPPRRHAFALRRGGGPWEHGEGPVAAAPANRPLQVSIAAQRSGQGARSPGREEEVTRRWGCGPGTGRRTPAGAGAVASAGAAEVLRGDRVQELPELLDLVLLLVRYRDAGLLQDVLAGEDRRAGAQGEGDGVGG